VIFDFDGLSPGTTYYFRAKAIGHATVYGDEGSFTMLTVPPTVATADPSNVGAYSVELKGDVISLGSAGLVDVTFEWGTASGGPYTNETHVGTATEVGEVTASLSGLTPGTTYYFRTKAAGHGNGYGDEKSFSTSTLPPLVSSAKVSRLTAESAVLTGELINLGTAPNVVISVEWSASPEGPYFDTAEDLTMNAPGAFTFELGNLEADKTYYFRVKVDGDTHGVGYGDGGTITKAEEPFNWLLMGSAVAGAVLIALPAMMIARAVTGRRRAQW
jgi:phosphodiesterase/alkaline phosphatase D-like protein